MKKFLSFLLGLAVLSFVLVGCGSSQEKATETKESRSEQKVAMSADTAGINDQAFSQSAWEGLQSLEKDTGTKVSYLEAKQEADYAPNLDKLVDDGNNLIWAVGYPQKSAMEEVAEMNPEVNFALVDDTYEEIPNNVSTVLFRAQDSSFLVGYAAALTSKTDKLGFVGGIEGNVISQFEYGYRSGVAYASKELNKEITVDVQYAESFSDSAKGKAITIKMYSAGADIVFHAAGNVGVGVIEAAKEADKFAIGVDRDQAYLAPENVLTSALKNVNVAVELISKKYLEGEKIGGKEFQFGIEEGAIGIPAENPNLDPEVYSKTKALEDKMKNGEIVPAFDQASFDDYLAKL